MTASPVDADAELTHVPTPTNPPLDRHKPSTGNGREESGWISGPSATRLVPHRCRQPDRSLYIFLNVSSASTPVT